MRHPPRLSALLGGAVLTLASAVSAVSAAAGAGTDTAPPSACSVVYSTVNQWDGGFQASVSVTNNGAPTTGWHLGFAFAGGQRLTQGWNATWSQSGATVTAVNESWNASLGTGAGVTLGLLGSWSGSNPAPTDFTLNGLACTGGSSTPPTPSPTPTTSPTTPSPTGTPTGTPAGAPELGVSGNRLTDPSGTTRRLLGVNRSGGEYMCVQGHGIFDGPVDDAAVQAIADWRANTVRITLNEECWLGLDDIRPEYRGTAYVDAVKALVGRVLAHGMTPVVELHWTYGQYTGASAGCSDVHASCQKPMPDAQYAPAFWTSVANTFKDDRRVVFDLFNEPYPDRATATTDQAWACWRDGGTCPGIGYEVAGMQDLVDAVRATGSRNVVLVPGIAYANDLSGWLAHAPTDPTGQLAAAWHVYNFNSCASETCWTSTLAPIAARVPLVAGEIGENTCGHAFVDRVMTWSDDRGLSYLGWTWNTWDCSSGPALISGYDGTPTAYGTGLRDHLRSLTGR
ncbi:cellulose binding domain-containing protein [Kitasatospora sp. NPDC093550]|uniref:cellulose binding domain-containing protein n=1 Tax=Kitasatospora sp. NPDC093550 TaxID=3364089 RepID=UPI00381CF36B